MEERPGLRPREAAQRQARGDRAPGVRLRAKVRPERRHGALQQTAGLNEEVFDALVLLAAGSFEHDAVARGYDAVMALKAEMDEGRQKRLRRLGFSAGEADVLSSLHTRNFM